MFATLLSNQELNNLGWLTDLTEKEAMVRLYHCSSGWERSMWEQAAMMNAHQEEV